MTNAETVARRADPDANAVERLDMEAVVALVPPKESALARAARAVSKLGDETAVFAAALIPLAVGVLRRASDDAPGRAPAGCRLGRLPGQGGGEHTVARTRPSELLEHGRHEVRLFGPDRKEWQSFPSGHLFSCSTALGRAWARCWPGARWPAAGAVTWVLALTRVPAGGHYPGDVAAGVVVGLAAEALAEWLVPAERQEDRPGGRP